MWDTQCQNAVSAEGSEGLGRKEKQQEGNKKHAPRGTVLGDWMLSTTSSLPPKHLPGTLGLLLFALQSLPCGAALLPSQSTCTSFSAVHSAQRMLASPPLIPASQDSAHPALHTFHGVSTQLSSALSSGEDQTVVAKQSIQGTTVANCLTQDHAWYFSVCMDYEWGKQ